MDYEEYGWTYEDAKAYFDGEEFIIENEGWWEYYPSEYTMLLAMTVIAPIGQWKFYKGDSNG